MTVHQESDTTLSWAVPLNSKKKKKSLFARGFRHFEVFPPWTFWRKRSFDRPANRVDVTFDGSLVSAGKHLWVRVNHFKQKGVFSLATIMPFHTNLKLVWSDCRWRQGKVTVRGKPVGTCSPATGRPVDRLSLLRLRFFPEFQRFEAGRRERDTSNFLWTVSTELTSTLFKQKSLNKTNWLPFNSHFHPLIPLHCPSRTSGIVTAHEGSAHTWNLEGAAPPMSDIWTKPLFTWLRHLLSGRNNTSGAFSWWQELEGYLSEGGF